MLQIQDPVHGYIRLDGMYADIVNTPEFQRLRSIEQVSFRPAFPGARHDRFIHSLGTYHLAVKFAEHFFRNLSEDTGIKKVKEEQKLKSTFLYAALLHDIGHAPFSHTTENFFKVKTDPDIWTQLCAEVDQVSPLEGALFRAAPKPVGAAHEIVSSIVLVSRRDRFLSKKDLKKVDLALAARMVIGYTYRPGDFTDPAELRSMGIRNCLIQLLNSSVLDVDRLDYLGRDTLMTGFVNAPLDLDTLASSVTAVQMADGTLAPAYRDPALRVFDLMFQAKLSHDAWVIANPGAVYDAALLKHCIRELYKNNSDMSTVFSVDALSREGISLNGKRYRLLSDVDVSADLKTQSGAPYDELHTRDLKDRRIASWRSYYEFRHLFQSIVKTEDGHPDEVNSITADDVYNYVKPLLKYLSDRNILFFDPEAYAGISRLSDQRITHPAACLHSFLTDAPTEAEKKGTYSVALLEQTSNLTLTEKVDPEQIRIVFPRRVVLPGANGRSYSTYAELTDVSLDNVRSHKYFHIFRLHGLGHNQLNDLRKALMDSIRDARAKGLL